MFSPGGSPDALTCGDAPARGVERAEAKSLLRIV
jgi:hypothetical protein